MDKLDIAIIRELFQGKPTSPTRPEIKLSYRAVAKRLHSSEGTVRTRARKLVDSGFIRGWVIHPNLNTMGLRECVLLVDAGGGPKGSVVERLGLIEGTVLLVNYHGTGIGMVFIYKDEKSLRRKLDLIAKVAGGPVQWYADIPYPPCSLTLGLVDWRIIACLQRRISSSYADVGRELGLSARSIKRRVVRMTAGGAAFILASGDESKLRDTLRCDLHVRWGDPDLRGPSEAELLRFLEDYNFFSGLWTTFSAFNLMVPSVPLAKELLEKASSLGGVDGARIEFVQERRETYDALSDLIDEKVAELARAAR